jgi:hypothetical protein
LEYVKSLLKLISNKVWLWDFESDIIEKRGSAV